MMRNCEAEKHSNKVPHLSVQHTQLHPTDISLFTIKQNIWNNLISPKKHIEIVNFCLEKSSALHSPSAIKLSTLRNYSYYYDYQMAQLNTF